MSDVSAAMPQYQCHKRVWALKIKAISITDDEIELTPEDEAYAKIRVETDWWAKHTPEPGGYYVVYPDGYKSYSPAKAFEEGYTRI